MASELDSHSTYYSAARMRRSPRHLSLALAWVVLCTGCVQWRSVPVAASPSLPRWVRVTTRDSVQRVLRDARVIAGDTLVGELAGGQRGAEVVRIPAVEIAHLEARLPSGVGSIGVAVLVLFGLAATVALIGHATTL